MKSTEQTQSAVDLAKNVFEIAVSAHHWAREITALDHSVVLLPPHHVRRYRGRNKTDRGDAKALLEAFRNEEIRPVPVKTVAQQTLTALHRLRSAWIAERTARINTLRGLLRELGFVIPVGAGRVLPQVRLWIEDAESGLPEALRLPLGQVCDEIGQINDRIRSVEVQVRALGRQTPEVQRLQTVPGVGPIIATALVAFIGDPHRFPSGRHLASFLGLTPREHSSGQKRRLGHIHKEGDPYLRTLIVHGARSLLWAARRSGGTDRVRAWALKLYDRDGHNKATVALANKLTRIIWAVWRRGGEYIIAPSASSA